MQTAKTSWQFENSVFEIRAIRENTRLIARCPCISDEFRAVVVLLTSMESPHSELLYRPSALLSLGILNQEYLLLANMYYVLSV